MKKYFVESDEVRNNALKLAKKIYDDGFIPDIIYVSLRGGAFLGNVISEFFKMINNKDHTVLYAAVVARSYKDINMKSQVHLDGWTYQPENLQIGDKILLIDDIFDSGQTINYLVNIILNNGLAREDIKVVVHDYKVTSDNLPILPDYWCRKIEPYSQRGKEWIHYLSHELEGLKDDEIHRYYLEKDSSLAGVFSMIQSFNKDS